MDCLRIIPFLNETYNVASRKIAGRVSVSLSLFACLLPCLLLCIPLCSCNKSAKGISVEADRFIEFEKEGLVKKRGYEFAYNDYDCQYVYNKNRKYVRLQRDDQSAYINVTSYELFSSPLEVGEFVDIELVYRLSASAGDNRESLSMLVLQAEDGKIWLWNETQKLGLILRSRK